MIQNKKLFYGTLIVGFLLCLGVDIPILAMKLAPVGTLKSAFFFIGNAIFGAVVYTLLYKSMEKTAMTKKIYIFALCLATIVLIEGIVMFFID